MMEHGFELRIEDEWNGAKSTSMGPTRDANGIPMMLFRECELLEDATQGLQHAKNIMFAWLVAIVSHLFSGT